MQAAVKSQEKLDIRNVVHSNENFPCKKWLKTLHFSVKLKHEPHHSVCKQTAKLKKV
jgi:hypothetical protein